MEYIYCTLFFIFFGSFWYISAQESFTSYSEGQIVEHIVDAIEEKTEVFWDERILSALTFLEQTQALNPENKRMYRILWDVVETLWDEYEIFYDSEQTVLSVNTIRTSIWGWNSVILDVSESSWSTKGWWGLISTKEEQGVSTESEDHWRENIQEKSEQSILPTTIHKDDSQLDTEGDYVENEARTEKNINTKKELDDVIDTDSVEWIPIDENWNEITPYEEKSDSYSLDRSVPYDTDFIEEEWLRWVNKLRKGQWLPLLSSDRSLTLRKTATERAEELKKKQYADHLRSSKQCQNPASNNYCYEYPKMVSWFEERDVTFVNVNRSTFTENIGRARYSCTDTDCTDEILASIRHVFDYFASEQSYNWVHRRTMVQKNFEIAWVWVTVDKDLWKAYVVVHYWTELE